MKTATEIRKSGVTFRSINGCELIVIVGKWNNSAKKPDYIWYMVSEKTGIHSITTQSNCPDSRVDAHWNGFIANQTR